MRPVVVLNSPGIREVLNSGPVNREVRALASRVASATAQRRPEADVIVDSYTTDRAAASVTVADWQAMLWQARDGLLTRAAADVGLTVRSR